MPDGSLFYVGNTSADTVGVIDTATTAVVALVNVGLYQGRGCSDP